MNASDNVLEKLNSGVDVSCKEVRCPYFGDEGCQLLVQIIARKAGVHLNEGLTLPEYIETQKPHLSEIPQNCIGFKTDTTKPACNEFRSFFYRHGKPLSQQSYIKAPYTTDVHNFINDNKLKIPGWKVDNGMLGFLVDNLHK